MRLPRSPADPEIAAAADEVGRQWLARADRDLMASMTLSWGVLPVASLGAGYLLTTLGPTGSLYALTAVMLATAIAATASPAVRHAPPLPTA